MGGPVETKSAEYRFSNVVKQSKVVVLIGRHFCDRIGLECRTQLRNDVSLVGDCGGEPAGICNGGETNNAQRAASPEWFATRPRSQ